jgi:hypothetical protein
MAWKSSQQRLLDIALIDMKRADAVPLSGICRKIGLRFRSARLLDLGKQPSINSALNIVFGYEGDKLTGHAAGCHIVIDKPVKNPAALPKAIEHPGVTQQL